MARTPTVAMSLVRGMHPATAELNKYRINQRHIGKRREPQSSQASVAFEMTGRRPLTEATADAIRSLLEQLGPDVAAKAYDTIVAGARLSFSERNPDRPIEHAFLPTVGMGGN